MPLVFILSTAITYENTAGAFVTNFKSYNRVFNLFNSTYTVEFSLIVVIYFKLQFISFACTFSRWFVCCYGPKEHFFSILLNICRDFIKCRYSLGNISLLTQSILGDLVYISSLKCKSTLTRLGLKTFRKLADKTSTVFTYLVYISSFCN